MAQSLIEPNEKGRKQNFHQTIGTMPDATILESLVNSPTTSPRFCSNTANATICRSCISPTAVSVNETSNVFRGRAARLVSANLHPHPASQISNRGNSSFAAPDSPTHFGQRDNRQQNRIRIVHRGFGLRARQRIRLQNTDQRVSINPIFGGASGSDSASPRHSAPFKSSSVDIAPCEYLPYCNGLFWSLSSSFGKKVTTTGDSSTPRGFSSN